MTKSAVGWGLSCLSVALLACPEDSPAQLEISSHQAALTATENSERALEGLLDAADFLADSTSMADTLNAFGGRSEDCATSPSYCSVGDASCVPAETVCTSSETEAVDLEQTREDLRQNVRELVRELRERILIPENLESETSTSATYRLGPSVLCDADASDAPGGAAPSAAQYDPDCVEQADRMQPRLRLTSPSEGDVDVAVLLGERRHVPLVLELHRQRLGVRLDLGEALAVARDQGEDTDAVEHLSGVLELALIENGARDYSLEVDVLEALQAVMKTDDGNLQLSLAATAPALELRLDGNLRRLSANVDLGALRVLGPLGRFADLFEGGDTLDVADAAGGNYAALPSDLAIEPLPEQAPARSYHGLLEFVLAGLEGTLEYVADSDVLHFSHLGLGDATSTIKHDGHTLLALDLNAALGRHVDLVLEPAGDGAKISISPGFDLSLALAFQQVRDQFDDLAEYLLDDTWHIWFAGTSPALVTADEQLRVDSGTLHLDTSAHPAENLSVSPGMCLLEPSADEQDGQSSPWDGLAAGVCQ